MSSSAVRTMPFISLMNKDVSTYLMSKIERCYFEPDIPMFTAVSNQSCKSMGNGNIKRLLHVS